MEPLEHLINTVLPGYKCDFKEQSPAFLPYFIHHLCGPVLLIPYSLAFWPLWTNNLLYTAFPKDATAFLVEIKLCVIHSSSEKEDGKPLQCQTSHLTSPLHF